jgi:hypothetical protein
MDGRTHRQRGGQTKEQTYRLTGRQNVGLIDQGTLTEGEGLVQLTSLHLLVSFNSEKTIYLCYKTCKPKEEVKCIEPSPFASIPSIEEWTDGQTDRETNQQAEPSVIKLFTSVIYEFS